MTASFLLTLSCRNRPGIVAGVSKILFDHGGDIREANQFDDAAADRFFMRVVFTLPGDAAALEREFAVLADGFGMEWKLRAQAERQRVLILVSKFDHCLVDLIYRWRIGELAMDVAGIVSNHPRETFRTLDLDGVPFHHLPVTAATKMEQEAQIKAIATDSGADLVVLARYMQILSDDLAAWLSGRCINIHHSFLPGFKGA
ncbi:MAG: formyltetrahydrofolate deformylase, partial [Sphingomonadaceae bacterium]